MLGLSHGNPIGRALPHFLSLYGAVIAWVVWQAVDGDSVYALMLVSLLGMVGLVVVALLLVVGRAFDRDMRRLLAGEYWAHWRYEPAEWRRFDETQSARDRREAWDLLKYSPIFGVVLGSIFAVLGGIRALGLTMALLCAAGLLTASVAGGYGWLDHRQRRRDASPAVYVGPRGVHRPEGYAPLVSLGRRLAGVELVAGEPAAIRFDVRERVRGGERQSDVWVPVPSGREAEARALVARFEREHGCPASAG